jgi:hypothetical protein
VDKDISTSVISRAIYEHPFIGDKTEPARYVVEVEEPEPEEPEPEEPDGGGEEEEEEDGDDLFGDDEGEEDKKSNMT